MTGKRHMEEQIIAVLVSGVKKLRQREDENWWLKQMVAEQGAGHSGAKSGHRKKLVASKAKRTAALAS